MMNMDEAKANLAMLEECIADPDFVGSVHSNEALRAANEWLNSNKASSADSFYQEVQAAVVEYAKIEKVLAMVQE